MRGLVAAGVCSSVVLGQFVEDFTTLDKWVSSDNERYEGAEWALTGSTAAGLEGDKVLLQKVASKHYATSASFDTPIDPKEKGIVVQYEVRLAEDHSCGGAYLKVLAQDDDFTQKGFKEDTGFVIMFGPDKCGYNNDKVHFIFRHKSPVTGEFEEKHLTDPPSVKGDRNFHLYTLVIRADETFEIYIDGESAKKGSLLEDFAPAVNPPAEIDDPTDSKPKTWVDKAMMNDPAESKPADWDEDAPMYVPDMEAFKPEGWANEAEIPEPGAVMPEEWNEEDDGTWEAPMVQNPVCESIGCGAWEQPEKSNDAYKGPWYHPQIDNPEYLGEWKAKQIANPSFFVDAAPHALTTMGAVGIEIWTTHAGMEFDNIFIGTDENAARVYAASTFQEKEKIQKAQKTEDAGGPGVLRKALDFVKENMIAVGVAVLMTVLALVYLCIDSKAPGDESDGPVATATKERNAIKRAQQAALVTKKTVEDEEEEEEEEEEEVVKPVRRSTRKSSRKAD